MAHQHEWELHEETNQIKRYKCACGKFGWKSRWNPKNKPIVEYKHDPKPLQEEVTAAPRAAGRNVSGGYLPPGGH